MSKFTSYVLTKQLLGVIAKEAKESIVWSGNDEQNEFLRREEQLTIHELESESQTGGVDKVNKFLTERGMTDALLPETTQPDAIAAAIYLLILSKWKVQGQKCMIKGDDQRSTYVGADLVCSIGKTFDTKFADIELENGDRVIMTQTTSKSDTLSGLESEGRYFAKLIYSGYSYLDNYEGVQFPHIDLDIKRTLHEIKGLQSLNSDLNIAEAKAQCKLKVNHIGVKLEVAMAAVAYRGMSMPKEKLVLNDTFDIHFLRKDQTTKKYVCYVSLQVTPEHFKEVTIEF